MRICGGTSRGRRLFTPRGHSLRITADRVKESLFDIVADCDGADVLDLFAGTGNVGIEAASRGARFIVFVEKNPRHIDIIKKNLDLCGMTEKSDVIQATVHDGIKACARGNAVFDIIFADPPYGAGAVTDTLRCLADHSVLAPGCIIVIEHSRKEVFESPKEFHIVDQRHYGDTVLTFLREKEHEGDNA